ncbi:MAG: hypothetical protein ACOH10_11300 [Rhodoglobus sp.]
MTTDRKDETLGLGARADLLYVASHWRDLTALLMPAGGGGQNGMPRAESQDPRLPIDVGVSDLMAEIEETARFYGRILCDETDWRPTTSAMPVLLAEVAGRFGHFCIDEREELEFCDMAHEMRTTMAKALAQKAPRKWIGPCSVAECPGELTIAEDEVNAHCHVCGGVFTLSERAVWLGVQAADVLMTRGEIVTALKMLGSTTQANTVKSWVQRGRLTPAEDGLYRLSDARALVERRKAAA